MSVASPVCRLAFTITALPQTLAITFGFEQATELRVLNGGQLNQSIDPPATLGLTAAYTVAGGGYNAQNQLLTGSVTILATNAVQVGDIITVLRNMPDTQVTTFKSTGLQTPLMIERDADRLTEAVQETKDALGRCLTFTANETVDPTMLLSLRKNHMLSFDNVGRPVFPVRTSDVERLILANPVGGMPNYFDWGIIGTGNQQFFDWGVIGL